jgi:hypothetical protein
MTDSCGDGEALNAIRLANRMLKEHKLTWAEALVVPDGLTLAELKEAVNIAANDGYLRGRSWRPDSWHDTARAILDCEDVTPWEREFFESFLERSYPMPTDKQRAIFIKVAQKCGVRYPA